MKTRDDAIFWMLHNIRFSRYDRKFLNSIWSKRLARDLPVSPKQSDVITDMFGRYRSQLVMFNITPETLISLPYKNPPDTILEPKNYEMFVGDDSRIYFMSPFNKELVDLWRAQRNHYESEAEWNPELKTWSESISAHSLRCFLTFRERQNIVPLSEFKLCDDLEEFVRDGNLGTKAQWQTLVRWNGASLLINCINEHLAAALPDELSLDPGCLLELQGLGVDIDASIVDAITDDTYTKQLMQNRKSNITYDDVDSLCHYLDLVPRASIALDISDYPAREYIEAVKFLQTRYRHRITIYKETSNVPEDALLSWLSVRSYDLSRITQDNIDICITATDLFNSRSASSPADIAKKIFYLTDPKHDPRYYETSSTA